MSQFNYFPYCLIVATIIFGTEFLGIKYREDFKLAKNKIQTCNGNKKLRWMWNVWAAARQLRRKRSTILR
jgi:hypothetical protein